jgi:hypothetical protein
MSTTRDPRTEVLWNVAGSGPARWCQENSVKAHREVAWVYAELVHGDCGAVRGGSTDGACCDGRGRHREPVRGNKNHISQSGDSMRGQLRRDLLQKPAGLSKVS